MDLCNCKFPTMTSNSSRREVLFHQSQMKPIGCQNCGVELYADYPTHDRDMLHRSLATIPHYKRAPSNSCHGTQDHPARPTSSGFDSSNPKIGSTAPNPYSNTPTKPAHHSIHVADTGNILAGSSQPRRYFEFCINTSRRHICLRELLLDGSGSKQTQPDIQTDAQLFQKIHDTYLEVRRGSRFSFLYLPSTFNLCSSAHSMVVASVYTRSLWLCHQ
jgi:hypothetical protein